MTQMWIRTEDGSVINLSRITSIFVVKTADDFEVKVAEFPHSGKKFSRMYRNRSRNHTQDIYANNFVTLQTFDNASDAQAFIKMLMDCLNGEKPIGYAFTWLKNYGASEFARLGEPAETKNESAETKFYDADLVDGVPL